MPRTVEKGKRAFLLFADIQDSSVYSSTLDLKSYADQLIKFQEVFEELGCQYFPALSSDERTQKYQHIGARGDEGTIFIYNPTDPKQQPEIMGKLLRFACELKAKFEFIVQPRDPQAGSPNTMKIGIGIHYGPVAYVLNTEPVDGEYRQRIEKLEGFSINYAKRLESASRQGRHSKIFLSKESAKLLEGELLVLKEHSCDMKGIRTDERVYELQSFVFQPMPLIRDDVYRKNFRSTFVDKRRDHDTSREPWLKSMIISIAKSEAEAAENDLVMQGHYADELKKIAWDSFRENDPMTLFTRGIILQGEDQLSGAVEIFKTVSSEYPELVHVRAALAKACYEICKEKADRPEKVYAKNVAREMIENFPQFILNEQERALFEKMLQE